MREHIRVSHPVEFEKQAVNQLGKKRQCPYCPHTNVGQTLVSHIKACHEAEYANWKQQYDLAAAKDCGL